MTDRLSAFRVQNLDLSIKEDLCLEDTWTTEDTGPPSSLTSDQTMSDQFSDFSFFWSTEVWSRLNEAVRLPCLRPSNVAVLTWTWTRTPSLPETLFLRSADGSLSFLASPATFDRYVCEAEEGGVKEVVARYVVRQSPSPRNLQRPDWSRVPEDRFEDIPTVEPAAEGSERKDRKLVTEDQLQRLTEQPKDRQRLTEQPKELQKTAEGQRLSAGLKEGPQEELQPTSRKDPRSDGPRDMKTYYGELVVVSLLLAASLLVLVLGSVHIWRLKKTGPRSDRLVPPEDCSKTNTSIEICSLSPPEDGGPEQTIVY